MVQDSHGSGGVCPSSCRQRPPSLKRATGDHLGTWGTCGTCDCWDMQHFQKGHFDNHLKPFAETGAFSKRDPIFWLKPCETISRTNFLYFPLPKTKGMFSSQPISTHLNPCRCHWYWLSIWPWQRSSMAPGQRLCIGWGSCSGVGYEAMGPSTARPCGHCEWGEDGNGQRCCWRTDVVMVGSRRMGYT